MIFDTEIAELPKIDDQRLVENKDLIDSLIMSIICGENPIENETYQDWRARIESIAIELEKSIYK
jgi:hypothetical protein